MPVPCPYKFALYLPNSMHISLNLISLKPYGTQPSIVIFEFLGYRVYGSIVSFWNFFKNRPFRCKNGLMLTLTNLVYTSLANSKILMAGGQRHNWAHAGNASRHGISSRGKGYAVMWI